MESLRRHHCKWIKSKRLPKDNKDPFPREGWIPWSSSRSRLGSKLWNLRLLCSWCNAHALCTSVVSWTSQIGIFALSHPPEPRKVERRLIALCTFDYSSLDILGYSKSSFALITLCVCECGVFPGPLESSLTIKTHFTWPPAWQASQENAVKNLGWQVTSVIVLPKYSCLFNFP